MKRQLISIVFINMTIWSIAINTNGQTATSGNITDNFVIGITSGFTIPTGNFAKTDYNNAASGFAGPGYNIGITGSWQLGKHFGISALVSYQQYSFRGIQNLADGFHESFDVDSASATTRGSNHSVSILAGPYYSMPLSAKLSIDFRVLIGIVNSTLAGWDVVLTDAGITHPPLTQNVSNAVALGGQAGIGVRYKISEHWAVMVNGDYCYSKPDFSVVNLDRLANAGRLINNYNQPIAGMNTNISLLYKLHNK